MQNKTVTDSDCVVGLDIQEKILKEVLERLEGYKIEKLRQTSHLRQDKKATNTEGYVSKSAKEVTGKHQII